LARVENVLKAATAPSCRTLVASGVVRNRQKTECQCEQSF